MDPKLVSIIPNTTVTTTSDTTVVRSLVDIRKEITSIDALQIELIGSKIVGEGLNSLGPDVKARVPASDKVQLLRIAEMTIREVFSNPDKFLAGGCSFRYSALTSESRLSSRRRFYLELDQELTQEKSELVFVLIEKSEGVEFSRETFTIKELEEEFRHS